MWHGWARSKQLICCAVTKSRVQLRHKQGLLLSCNHFELLRSVPSRFFFRSFPRPLQNMPGSSWAQSVMGACCAASMIFISVTCQIFASKFFTNQVEEVPKYEVDEVKMLKVCFIFFAPFSAAKQLRSEWLGPSPTSAAVAKAQSLKNNQTHANFFRTFKHQRTRILDEFCNCCNQTLIASSSSSWQENRAKMPRGNALCGGCRTPVRRRPVVVHSFTPCQTDYKGEGNHRNLKQESLKTLKRWSKTDSSVETLPVRV